MFICEDCVKKMGCFAMPVSRGLCEECGKTGNCADIKASVLNKWDAERRRKNVTKLRNVKLAAKFVFRAEPGVYKKVSSNKARCIFGPKEVQDIEVGMDPESEVFVVDEREKTREKPRIERPDSNDRVKVIFEEDDKPILERTVTFNEAVIMSRSDFVGLRPAPRKRQEIFQIGESGWDLEEKALHLDIMARQTVPPKKKGERDDARTVSSKT